MEGELKPALIISSRLCRELWIQATGLLGAGSPGFGGIPLLWDSVTVDESAPPSG